MSRNTLSASASPSASTPAWVTGACSTSTNRSVPKGSWRGPADADAGAGAGAAAAPPTNMGVTVGLRTRPPLGAAFVVVVILLLLLLPPAASRLRRLRGTRMGDVSGVACW